jgi:hypothetical protein
MSRGLSEAEASAMIVSGFVEPITKELPLEYAVEMNRLIQLADGGFRRLIDVERVDYVRVPVTDMDEADRFYGEVLGLERNPNSPGGDWVEYEVGNLTLAVMTPHTHDYEFACPRRSRCVCRTSRRRRRSSRPRG